MNRLCRDRVIGVPIMKKLTIYNRNYKLWVCNTGIGLHEKTMRCYDQMESRQYSKLENLLLLLEINRSKNTY